MRALRVAVRSAPAGGHQRRTGKVQLFCSRSCSSQYPTERKLAALRVRHAVQRAGAAERRAQQVLNRADRDAAKRVAQLAVEAERLERLELLKRRQCQVCGTEFSPRIKRGHQVQLTCSSSCADKRDKAIRQARKRAGGGELVSPWKVFERDRWLCWICGSATSARYLAADPLSPTMDHVTPISRGGAHSYANIKCAHAICNARKSDALAA